MDDFFPDDEGSAELNEWVWCFVKNPVADNLRSQVSALQSVASKLDQLCSILSSFHMQDFETTSPTTYSERPLEDTEFDKDEPAFDQKKWSEIIGPNYLSDVEPVNDASLDDAQNSILDTQREQTSGVATPETEPVAATHAEDVHTSAADDVPVDAQTPEEDALSDYSLNSLFDEVPGEHGEETSGETTRHGAAPESTVTPGTPPDDHKDHKLVIDEDTDSVYSLDLLFNDASDEHKNATTAVDASAANTPAEADMAMELPTKDDAPAGHKSSTMSPPTQEGSVDDRHNDLTPSEGEPTDNEQKADAPSTDVAMVSETAGHASVECTPVKAPLEMASAMDKSEERASIHKVPASIKYGPIEIQIEYGPAQDTHLQNAPVQSAPVQDTVMEDLEDELNQKVSVENASAKDDGMKDTSTADAPMSLAPINVRIEYANPENAPGQTTSVHDVASKDAEVLEDAPLEEAQAESASAEHEEEEYDPNHAPLEYASQSNEHNTLQDTVIDDAPVEYIPSEEAPTADVPMDDAPKEDTTMPDALTTEELDPADVLNALTLLPQPVPTPHNDFIKAETAQSPTVSPLSSPPSSPPPQKGLRQLVTASRSAATLQQARKRKVDKGRHSVSPPAKRKRLDTATTAKVPVPRLKRRLGQGVSARRVTTRSVTAAAKLAAPQPAVKPAVKPAVRQPTPPPFSTTPLLGKRKAYTSNAGNSPAPSANKRCKLSPTPAPAPATTVTRRKTAIPTVTARHTRSMGPKCLLYSADILALERGLRRG